MPGRKVVTTPQRSLPCWHRPDHRCPQRGWRADGESATTCQPIWCLAHAQQDRPLRGHRVFRWKYL